MALMNSAEGNNFIVPRRLKDNQLGSKLSGERKVPVVYYLSRNNQLDQPHFIEVSLSSHSGLYLKDVINRLNDLRGKGMPCLYSWSSKRIYKNGFVWHDLSEDDFIFPVYGHEYVLKGSQILDLDKNSGKESNFPATVSRRRNKSWSSIEYKVVKASESSTESTNKLATDASTQTDDRRRKMIIPIKQVESPVNEITELSREEISSPPQSDSSPETLETLMKADRRLILRPDDKEPNRSVDKMRPSAVLMQLISCGAMSFKKCGPALITGRTGTTVERGTGNCKLERAENELRSFGRVKLEEEAYFSGSLIDKTKKELVPALKRSSSYNSDSDSDSDSDRSLRIGLRSEKYGEEMARAKFISRKPKNLVDSNNKAEIDV